MNESMKDITEVKELLDRAKEAPDKSVIGILLGKEVKITLLSISGGETMKNGSFKKKPRYKVVKIGVDKHPDKSLLEMVEKTSSPAELNEGITDISENYKKHLYDK